VVIGGVVAVGLWQRGGHESKSAETKGAATVAVTVVPVTPRAVQRTVNVVGSLFGRDEVTLATKVDGRVLKLHADVGDRLKPGAVLAEIDPVDLKLAVEEARRGLELELARLGLTRLPTGTFEVTNLPSVVRAMAQERNALARRERLRRLGSATSVEELENAEKDHAVAQADLRVATLDAQATLAAARQRAAILATAEQRLADATIRTPTADASTEFVVCSRDVAEGEMVHAMPIGGPSTGLFKLVVDVPLKFKASVPERHRAEVQAGQTVTLEVEAYPGTPFAGTIARVNPSVDRASRMFMVEVTVPNAEHKLSPGSFAKAVIRTHTDPTARTVPEEALHTFAGVTKVFILKGEVVQSVNVRVGATVDVNGAAWVEIVGDVPTDAKVVTSGHAQLADGTAVRVR
jgi:RND family efflux transporter MFP subunit